MNQKDIRALVSNMTLEEKAALTSGRDYGYTKAVERLAIPAVRVNDGPSGIHTQDESPLTDAVMDAVCYPASCLTAASFDRELIEKLGQALGQDAKALGIDILLAPGVNIKRSPLCGRNFEYFSEDPLLAGEMGAAFTRGVQSEGVGVSLKHFFANNQEYRRMDASSEMDERTMREIYLPAFENIVKNAKPWTIMASYNKIDGVHATANKIYLTDLLRGKWGFEGLVVSDWGATHDRVAAIQAGCDLTMPAENTDSDIIQAVKEGRLPEADLDLCCERILTLTYQSQAVKKGVAPLDIDGHHRLARQIAAESMVLLKNDGILPLSNMKDISFIGAFADTPRIQGGGSSHVRATHVVSALEAAKRMGYSPRYAAGYKDDGSTDDNLLAEAVALAKDSQTVILFIGLTDNMESEGVDRPHMRLPEGHNTLISAVCAANPNTVVVLHNGSPVEMPWVDSPRAILESYLAGEAAGEAVLDVLTGVVNPSGHLPETFPLRLEDNPSYLFFGGEGGRVRYQEGVFVGYRYYESKKQNVLFPFGYGQSYTTFMYSDLVLDKNSIDEGDALHVSVAVTNTGKSAGKAVVQLYVAPQKVEIIRPVRELKDFAKVALQPGERKTVAFTLEKRAFAHWNETIHAWRCESGKYTIQIGENARDIALNADVQLNARPLPPLGGYTLSMPMSVMAAHPDGRKFLDENLIHLIKGMAMMGYIPKEMLSMIESLEGGLTLDVMDAIARRAGAQGGSGISALLMQGISILDSVLPDEKKAELRALLDYMNKR